MIHSKRVEAVAGVPADSNRQKVQTKPWKSKERQKVKGKPYRTRGTRVLENHFPYQGGGSI